MSGPRAADHTRVATPADQRVVLDREPLLEVDIVYSVIRVAAPLSAARSQLEAQVATQRETIHEMSSGGWTYVTTTPEPHDAAGSRVDQTGAELLIFWRAAMVPSQTGRPVGDGRWRTAHPAGTDERGRAAG